MKRNAIIRIIAWTVSLVILVGLLIAGMNWFRPFGRTSMETPSSSAPMVNANRLELPSNASDAVREIEIDWLAGNIRLEQANVDSIEVRETPVDDARSAMVCKQEGQTLKIEYCQSNTFGSWKNLKLSKDLTILVPMDWNGRAVKVDAASAKLAVQDLTIAEVEIDTASGECRFDGCTVDTLDIDTASGDISFNGSLNRLDCDSASAGVQAELDNVPYEIDMDTASGGLELYLPEDAGFSVSMDTMSGKFDSTFPAAVKNGRYVCGDGACKIDMSSMSGGVTIRSR